MSTILSVHVEYGTLDLMRGEHELTVPTRWRPPGVYLDIRDCDLAVCGGPSGDSPVSTEVVAGGFVLRARVDSDALRVCWMVPYGDEFTCDCPWG